MAINLRNRNILIILRRPQSENNLPKSMITIEDTFDVAENFERELLHKGKYFICSNKYQMKLELVLKYFISVQ